MERMRVIDIPSMTRALNKTPQGWWHEGLDGHTIQRKRLNVPNG